MIAQTKDSIEYGTQGRVLSDGHRYRVEDQGRGSGYEVYKEGDENWHFVGRIYPSRDSEAALVRAVEEDIVSARY